DRFDVRLSCLCRTQSSIGSLEGSESRIDRDRVVLITEFVVRRKIVIKFVLVVILLGCALAGTTCCAGNIEPGVGIRAGVLSYNKTQIDASRVYWGGHGRL